MEFEDPYWQDVFVERIALMGDEESAFWDTLEAKVQSDEMRELIRVSNELRNATWDAFYQPETFSERVWRVYRDRSSGKLPAFDLEDEPCAK